MGQVLVSLRLCRTAPARWRAEGGRRAPVRAHPHPQTPRHTRTRKRRAACAGGPRQHGQRGKHAQHITSSAAATNRLLPTQLAANSGARLASPQTVSNAGNQDPVHRSRRRSPPPRPAGAAISAGKQPAAPQPPRCAAKAYLCRGTKSASPCAARFHGVSRTCSIWKEEEKGRAHLSSFVFCGCIARGMEDGSPPISRDSGGTAAGACLNSRVRRAKR